MKFMTPSRIILLALILLILPLSDGFTEEERPPIVLAFPENFFTTDRQLLFIEDLREAFRRIGYEMILEFYPRERCLIMVNSGEVDGLPQQVANTDLTYKNLVRVDEPVSQVVYAAYAVNENIQIQGWDSLSETPRNILYIYGMQSIRSKLSTLLPEIFLSAILNRESALLMLIAERGDILIDRKDALDGVISQNKVAYKTIREVGILGWEEQYLFLHKSHEDLVPPLEKCIADMKREDFFLYDSIY